MGTRAPGLQTYYPATILSELRCASQRAPSCAGTAWRVHVNVAGDRFEELRQLCTAAGDKASLAIAMAGLVIDHAYHDRIREASQLASEAMALIESLGDPALTVGLSLAAVHAKVESGELSDALRWSQAVIDLADGDPSKGNFVFGSPLALALAMRGVARNAAWVVLDGETTCGTASTWPAAPIRCPAPRSSRAVYFPGDTQWRAQAPTIARCARSTMPCRLPNDPAMISRWPSPG